MENQFDSTRVIIKNTLSIKIDYFVNIIDLKLLDSLYFRPTYGSN